MLVWLKKLLKRPLYPLDNRGKPVYSRPAMPRETIWLTVSQFAQQLGVSAQTIRRWEAEGRIPPGSRTRRRYRRWPLDVVNAVVAAEEAGDTALSQLHRPKQAVPGMAKGGRTGKDADSN